MIATHPPGADDLRSRLAYHLATSGAVTSPHWRDAFAQTPRHVFAEAFDRLLPDGQIQHFDGADITRRAEWLDAVYCDDALVTQHDPAGTATSSSSQPTVMAQMLEALDAYPGDAVLEIGTGTGYNAALLCHYLGDGHVASVDIDPLLVDQARKRLAAIGYRPTLVAADGLAGWPDGAPYERIIGTCSTRRVPAAWLAQTRTDGVIVANVGHGVVPLRVEADGSAAGRFLAGPASFIEARPADAPGDMPFDAAIELVYAQGEHTRSADPVAGIGDEAFWFVVHIVMPGHVWFELHEDDSRTYCLVDPVTRSWYRATEAAGRMTVTQAGPRRVWDDLTAIHAQWEAAGRPSHDRLGLTVTPAGGHTLWVDEPGRHSWTLA